jgi:hypothetical protein
MIRSAHCTAAATDAELDRLGDFLKVARGMAEGNRIPSLMQSRIHKKREVDLSQQILSLCRAIPHPVARGRRACLLGCTSRLRCLDRLPSDGGRRVPTNPPCLRPAEQTRGLVSNRPWLPECIGGFPRKVKFPACRSHLRKPRRRCDRSAEF